MLCFDIIHMYLTNSKRLYISQGFFKKEEGEMLLVSWRGCVHSHRGRPMIALGDLDIRAKIAAVWVKTAVTRSLDLPLDFSL